MVSKNTAGKVRLVFDFDYDGGGLHKGATGSIAVNGKTVDEGVLAAKSAQ